MNDRLGISALIAAALAINCDDTSADGLARIQEAALALARVKVESSK